LTLTLEASRLLWAWWCGLHALLAAAAVLVGWPWALKLAAVGAIAVHAVARRPPPSPASVIVAADATCVVPERGPSRVALGPRTVVCALWIRLDLGPGPPTRDIVLFVDQLPAGQWASLRALLDRARCDSAHVSSGPKEPI
jgi:hypothetical protein